jgi:hypothetical protein
MSINRGGSVLRYYTRSKLLSPNGFEGGHKWMLAPAGVKGADGTFLRPVIFYLRVHGTLTQGYISIEDLLPDAMQDPHKGPHLYVSAVAMPTGIDFTYDDPIVGRAGAGFDIGFNGPSQFGGDALVAISYSVGYILAQNGVDS